MKILTDRQYYGIWLELEKVKSEIKDNRYETEKLRQEAENLKTECERLRHKISMIPPMQVDQIGRVTGFSDYTIKINGDGTCERVYGTESNRT